MDENPYQSPLEPGRDPASAPLPGCLWEVVRTLGCLALTVAMLSLILFVFEAFYLLARLWD